jgi:hypothetical protein
VKVEKHILNMASTSAEKGHRSLVPTILLQIHSIVPRHFKLLIIQKRDQKIKDKKEKKERRKKKSA